MTLLLLKATMGAIGEITTFLFDHLISNDLVGSFKTRADTAQTHGPPHSV